MKPTNRRIPALLPNASIRIHSWTWVVISILLIALQLSFPSRTWTTLLIIVGGTWLIAFLWTFFLGRGLSLNREMRYGWAQVGDVLQERYTVYNDAFPPAVWLEVQDHSTIPDYQTGRVTSISGGQILSWQTEGTCTRRGLFTLGPTSLLSGDPLGLCSVEVRQPHSTVLLVLPPVLPLPTIDIAAGGFAGEGRFKRHTALESTVSVESIREYAQGDPLHAIHWPTSARRNALFVRQFDHMPQADWWIVLDLEQRAQAGSGARSTEEYGIILAASMANRGIRQSRKVGLVTHGADLTWLPPRHSSGHLMEIMRALAIAQTGTRPLTDLLTESQRSIRRGASLIVITSNDDGKWLAPLLRLSASGIIPTVLLLDPAAFGSERSIKGVDAILNDHGISHSVIPPELFDREEARPGKQGKWEWKVVAPGKIIAVHRPAQSEWRQLG